MDEIVIERWLHRRLRSTRFALFSLGLALVGCSILAYNFVWFCLFVPLGLIGLGIGLPAPGAGSTLFITATTVGYFFIRKKRPLPVPQVTRLEGTRQPAIIIPPLREHWLRVRSRDQTAHLSLRSLFYDLLFLTPMLLESGCSVLRHWRRLGGIDSRSCARVLAVLHRDLNLTSLAKLEQSLPDLELETVIGQLWWLDEVQFINSAKQGLILTEQARTELASAEDAALIASVG